MWSEILKHKEIFPHFFFNIFGLQDSHIGRGEEGYAGHWSSNRFVGDSCQ